MGDGLMKKNPSGWAAPRAASAHVIRESGFEVLRILAMLMVTAHHFVLYNSVDAWSLPLGPERLVFTTAFYGLGKVGVVCFFGISAWFLCEGGRGGIALPFAGFGSWSASSSSIPSRVTKSGVRSSPRG